MINFKEIADAYLTGGLDPGLLKFNDETLVPIKDISINMTLDNRLYKYLIYYDNKRFYITDTGETIVDDGWSESLKFVIDYIL